MKKIVVKFNEEIIRCMKEKEKERLGALRILKSEFLSEVKDKHAEENDITLLAVGARLYKQMDKALELNEDPKNRMLLNVCKEYMPKITTKEEIWEFLESTEVADINKNSLMKQLKTVFGSSLNGRIAIQVVDAFLKKYGGKI